VQHRMKMVLPEDLLTMKNCQSSYWSSTDYSKLFHLIYFGVRYGMFCVIFWFLGACFV